MMLFTASESRNRVMPETRENTVRLTNLVAGNQDQLIDAARDILITLSQLPAVQSQDRPACLFFLSNVLMQHPLYANFGAVDKDGTIFCMTRPQRHPYNISQEDYFQQSILKQDFVISEYYISDTSSEAMITLAYPVISEAGTSQGIVFANLDLRWLGSFMNAAALPANSTLRVIDRKGTILASYPDGSFEIGRKMPEENITATILSQQIGLVQDYDVNGIERLFSFTKLKAGGNSDIFVMISVPIETAFSESNTVLNHNLIALLLGAFIALMIAWFGTNFFFLRQVNDLVDVTQRLSGGDLSARTKWQYGSNELDKLAIAFDEMAVTIQQREMEQKLAKIQIEHQKEQAEALTRITERLNTTLQLDKVLQAVCDETCTAMNASAAVVMVYLHTKGCSFHVRGPDANGVSLKNVYPISVDALKKSSSFQDEHIIMVDLDEKPDLIPEEIRNSLNSQYLFGVNLNHEGKLIGRLDLYSTENILTSSEDLTFLKGIANSAALAISNAHLVTALKQEERNRADLLHKVIGAQENERMRISRELHDETSQSLTALLLGLDTIEIASKGSNDEIKKHIVNLKGISVDMLDNIHRLIADLRPSLLDDLGLVAAIEWYGEQRLKQKGIAFDLKENILEERFERPVETILFRIVQEGITNALRHANPSVIRISLLKNHDFVKLEICDDGIGFDVSKLETLETGGRGLGLMGMRERAAILGGKFEIESTPGEGTMIRILFKT